MIAEIGVGLGSLKSAKDLLQAFNGVQTAAAVADVKIALQGLIFEARESLFAAQEAHSTLTARVRDLEQQIVQLKDWTAEQQRYELRDLGRGSFAYMPKPTEDPREPPHWLCANCFAQSRKSFLQFKGQDKRPGGGNGDEAAYGCDACRATLKVRYTVKPSATPAA
jgi:hypothetical protein